VVGFKIALAGLPGGGEEKALNRPFRLDENYLRILLIRKRDQDTILKPRESAAARQIVVQNQDLTSRAA
jgi:hypothetical protein